MARRPAKLDARIDFGRRCRSGFPGSSGWTYGLKFSAARHFHGPRRRWPDDVLRAGGNRGLYQPELAGRTPGKNKQERGAAPATPLLDVNRFPLSATQDRKSVV